MGCIYLSSTQIRLSGVLEGHSQLPQHLTILKHVRLESLSGNAIQMVSTEPDPLGEEWAM